MDLKRSVRAKAGFDSQAESFFGNTLTDRHYAVQNVQKSKPRTIREKRTYFTKIAASPLVWYRYLPYPYGRDVT